MAAATLVALLLAAAPKAEAGPRWARDLAAAEAEARARGVPVMALFGAAWCPECLAARQLLASDPALAAATRAQAWVEIDVDAAAGAELANALRVADVPALVVLDPVAGVTVRRTPAVAEAAPLRGFLELRKVPALDEAEAALGDGAAAAVAAWIEALQDDAVPAAGRTAALHQAMAALRDLDPARCLALHERSASRIQEDGRPYLAARAGACAAALPDGAEPEARAELEARVRAALPRAQGLTRTALLGWLQAAERARGDAAARASASAWWRHARERLAEARGEARWGQALLAAAAARGAGEPAAGLAAIDAAVRPGEQAPWTLALARGWLLVELGRPREALAAADAALAGAGGAGRLLAYALRARALESAGDAPALRETLASALAYRAKLPAALPGSPQRLAAAELEERAAKLGQTSR